MYSFSQIFRFHGGKNKKLYLNIIILYLVV